MIYKPIGGYFKRYGGENSILGDPPQPPLKKGGEYLRVFLIGLYSNFKLVVESVEIWR